jgi:hypothetical protein
LLLAGTTGLWLLGLSLLLKDYELFKKYRTLTTGSILEQLSAYGDRETIIAEIENELTHPLYSKYTLTGHPYFYATDKWILNFAKLPGNFAMKVTDIKKIVGSMRRSTGDMRIYVYFIVYDPDHDNSMTIPLYALKEQRVFYKNLQTRNPDIALEYPNSLRRYFNKVEREK